MPSHQTTFLTVAGRKTQLTRGGQGPPLVYLHSAGGETEWMPFHELLARRFTVYAPAHPGFAASEGLEEIRDIGDLAWHYVDLWEQLALGPVPVVGFSLGAWIALETAVLRPGLISRLVLAAAAGLHIEGAPIAELFIDDLDKLRRLVFFDPECPAADLAVPRSLDDTRIVLWMRAREATARVGWNPYLHNPRLRGHLHRVTCPSLVIWGRHDRLIPLAHGEYYARHLPQARLAVFENCGHMVPLEKPEDFVREATGFVQGDRESRK
jgi:pimeloyl-ACP methyl ester carboxylesterase